VFFPCRTWAFLQFKNSSKQTPVSRLLPVGLASLPADAFNAHAHEKISAGGTSDAPPSQAKIKKMFQLNGLCRLQIKTFAISTTRLAVCRAGTKHINGDGLAQDFHLIPYSQDGHVRVLANPRWGQSLWVV